MRVLILLLTMYMMLIGVKSFGEVNFSSPESVVSNAIEKLRKKEFQVLLSLTELAEKKRVEMIIEAYNNSYDKLMIDRSIEYLESFKVVDTYYEGEFAVVTVDWVVRGYYQSRDGVKSYNAVRKVLYLLKKFEDKWKIIAKKVRI
ncbi:MAG: hypothetical protein ABDH28_03105 [Brevinematia bacterium]